MIADVGAVRRISHNSGPHCLAVDYGLYLANVWCVCVLELEDGGLQLQRISSRRVVNILERAVRPQAIFTTSALKNKSSRELGVYYVYEEGQLFSMGFVFCIVGFLVLLKNV